MLTVTVSLVGSGKRRTRRPFEPVLVDALDRGDRLDAAGSGAERTASAETMMPAAVRVMASEPRSTRRILL
jgi:hypothetical protein